MANDGTIMLTAEDGSEDAFFVWEKDPGTGIRCRWLSGKGLQ